MRKVLVIRFSSIGDIVLTTPVVRCLKQQMEGVEVHYITKKAFKPILKENPFIDKLWLLDRANDQLTTELKKEGFDYVIDLHHNLRSGILKQKLGAPSFSFDKLNVQKWLMVNLKINRLPDRHIVDRYMETLSFFGIENDGKGLDYYLSDEDRILPADIGRRIPENYISLVAGAKHFTKKAPPAKLAAICSILDKHVVILGGPEDIEAADEIIRLSSNPAVSNYCGKLSLNQSASLIERSEVVISHDTGLMHIAAAFGKDIISLWGNTIPEFGMYPYLPGKKSRMFGIEGLSCRPCSKIGYSKCPKGHFKCMVDHDAAAIGEAVKNASGSAL